MWKDLKDYTDSDLILAFQDVGNTPRKMRDAIIDELARRRELGVRYAVKQPVSQTDAQNDEFWGGIWWVPDGTGKVRNATPGECAAEIMRLRDENNALRESQT